MPEEETKSVPAQAEQPVQASNQQNSVPQTNNNNNNNTSANNNNNANNNSPQVKSETKPNGNLNNSQNTVNNQKQAVNNAQPQMNIKANNNNQAQQHQNRPNQNQQQTKPNGNQMNRANSNSNLQNGNQKNFNTSNKQQQQPQQQQQKQQQQQHHNHNQQHNQKMNQNQKFKPQNGLHQSPQVHNQTQQQQQLSQQQSQQQEKKFTGRCRLFVGNLPTDITEQEFKELFSKYGETGECFLNTQRSFGFIKLDTRINAEHAKQELDGYTFKGRCIRVRFASHGAAVRVKNLSPFVSNEYLEQAFSTFGPVERAVVIVDDKGRATGEGIVEFERKPAASQCINRCNENCFILTSYPKPVIVEPLDQKDDEDGLPEKSIIKNQQYHSEREVAPHFAPNNSLELELALKWRDLYELEKQIREDGLKKIQEAREQLEYEIEVRLIDYKEQKLKEDLRAKQEELQRIEDMRKNEFQRRKDMEMRRQEEMMYHRKQDNNNMMMHQQNQRMPQMPPNNNSVGFDQPLINQPHMPPGPVGNNGGNQLNRRYDNNQNHMNQMPQQQQQAMLAAQLSAFAMAAAGNLNIPGMFDGPSAPGQGPMQNNNNNNNNNNTNNNRNDRRNFNNNNNRRGGGHGRGGNNAPHRDDQSPYPGYDTKRARY